MHVLEERQAKLKSFELFETLGGRNNGMLWVSIHEMRSTRELATFCRVTCYGQSASLQDLISQVYPYIIHLTHQA